MHTTTALAPKASFMGLPIELRLEIYGHLTSNSITKSLKEYRHDLVEWLQEARSKEPAIHPGILSTCRQIYREAAGLLYQHVGPCYNILALRQTPAYHFTPLSLPVLREIPERCRRFVKEIGILGDYSQILNGYYYSREILSRWFKDVSERYPAVEHVSLSIHFRYPDSDDTYDWECILAPLVANPGLKSVHVDATPFACWSCEGLDGNVQKGASAAARDANLMITFEEVPGGGYCQRCRKNGSV